MEMEMKGAIRPGVTRYNGVEEGEREFGFGLDML
jgi:hypothetical protein